MNLNNYNMKNQNARIDSLQALRAFAAISVMAFHGSGIINERLGYNFLNNVFKAGFSGVDIFFVLSGFIIFYISSIKKSTIKDFIAKRFVRIYPVYWVVTFLLILMYFLSPSADQAHKGDISVIVGSLLLLPQKQMISGVAWTLTYEIIFYIVFALTFFKSLRLFAWTFAAWVVAITAATLLDFKSNIFLVDFLLNTVIINFAYGCLVGYFYLKYPVNSYWKVFALTGAVLFITAWTLEYKGIISGGGSMRCIYFGIPAAILIYGILYFPYSIPKLLTHLGDASYSLYLLHGSIISLIIKVIDKVHLNNAFSNFGGAIGIFIITLMVTSVFYMLVEKPLLNISQKLVLPKKKKPEPALMS